METVSGTPGQRHPVLGCAARIEIALKDVADVEPVFMSPDDKATALTSLATLSSMLEGLRMRVLAASDDLAETVGSRDVTTVIAPRTRESRGGLRRLERLGRDLDTRWRQLEAALGDGRVNLDQAFVIARALNTLVDGDLARDPEARCADLRPGTPLILRAEAKLIELAAEWDPEGLRRLGDGILEIIAPEIYEDEERKKLEAAERRAAAQTRLTLRNRGDGTADLKARIPEHAAARLKQYLDAYTSPRHDAMTRTGCGTHTPAIDLVDPATGRRLPHDRVLGEAFCAFLEHADPAKMPLHGGSATTVVVTMRLADLVTGTGAATLPDGTRISPGQTRRLACTAGILPAVLDDDSRVLDLGRARRLFDADQRVAMAVRDRTCRAEDCTVPADWTEAHHRRPWSKGGHTDIEDGVLLCPWHHHRAHDPGYTHAYLPNGDVRFHRRR